MGIDKRLLLAVIYIVNFYKNMWSPEPTLKNGAVPKSFKSRKIKTFIMKNSLLLFVGFLLITGCDLIDPSSKTTKSTEITGVWYAPGCGSSKGHTLTLTGSATSGIGNLASIDCNGICNPIILKFNYTISGSTMVWNFFTTQPLVYCTGYDPLSPKTPASSSHTISGVSANSFTLDSQVFNR